jgi:hypothetical protein
MLVPFRTKRAFSEIRRHVKPVPEVAGDDMVFVGTIAATMG